MVASMLFSRLKNTLDDNSRSELFSYIKWIKFIWNTVTIITQKPLINSEFKSIEEQILNSFGELLYDLDKASYKSIKIKYK